MIFLDYKGAIRGENSRIVIVLGSIACNEAGSGSGLAADTPPTKDAAGGGSAVCSS